MESLRNYIHSKQLSADTAGKNLIKPAVTAVRKKLTVNEVKQCDITLLDYKDLMPTTPDGRSMNAWYCKMFYTIGRERFEQLARQARADGKVPARLFSYLLKKEVGQA